MDDAKLHKAFMLLFNRKLYIIIMLFTSLFIIGLVLYKPIVSHLAWAGLSEEGIKKSVAEKFHISPQTIMFIPIIISVNNIIAALITFILGFTVIGPIAVLVYNGIITGIVVSMAPGSHGIFSESQVALLAPHGSLEIPSIATSGAISAYYVITRAGRDKDILIGGIKMIIYIIITLAVIESFVTPVVSILDAIATKVIQAVL
jgi:uncharacterized membrane protein SpoIIM required for sporulation